MPCLACRLAGLQVREGARLGWRIKLEERYPEDKTTQHANMQQVHWGCFFADDESEAVSTAKAIADDVSSQFLLALASNLFAHAGMEMLKVDCAFADVRCKLPFYPRTDAQGVPLPDATAPYEVQELVRACGIATGRPHLRMHGEATHGLARVCKLAGWLCLGHGSCMAGMRGRHVLQCTAAHADAARVHADASDCGCACCVAAGGRAGALMRILLNDFVLRGFFSEDALLMARIILGWNYQSTCFQVYLRMVLLLVLEFTFRLTVTLHAGPGRPATVLGPEETQPVLEELAVQCATAARVRRRAC